MPGVQVFNASNNLVATYNLIQDAINDNTTLDGFKIVVNNNTYVEPAVLEQINNYKHLAITTSAFDGVDPTAGGRASGAAIANEVVIGGCAFSLGSATLNGFTVDAGFSTDQCIWGDGQFGDRPDIVVTNNRIINDNYGISFLNLRHATIQGNYFDNNTGVALGFSGIDSDISYNVFSNSGTNTAGFNADIVISGWNGLTTGTKIHNNVFNGPTAGATPKAIALFQASGVTIENNHYSGVNGIDVWDGDSSIIINEAATNFAITGSYVLLHPNALGVRIDPTFLDIGGTFVLSNGADLSQDAGTAPGGSVDPVGTGLFTDLGDALQGSVDGSSLLVSNDDFGAVNDNLDKATVVAGSGASADLTMGTHAKTLTLAGSGGLDVEGSAAANTIKGNSGSNDICGNGGSDKIDAGAGRDIVCGGMGADKLTGGTGRDVFDYNSVKESRGSTHDTITDFRHGTDKIDLRGIDAVSGTKKNEAFHFIGSAEFTGHKGELHIVIQQNITIIEGDVNGDGHADLQIIDLGGVGNPSRADFIL
jgi:Ca2+-binding RTX toxin-like protein